MAISQFLFSNFLFFAIIQAGSEKEFQIIEDISPQLKIFKESILKDNTSQNSRAVHLPLDLSQQREHYLMIESKKVFYLFINSAFVLKKRLYKIDVRGDPNVPGLFTTKANLK